MSSPQSDDDDDVEDVEFVSVRHILRISHIKSQSFQKHPTWF